MKLQFTTLFFGILIFQTTLYAEIPHGPKDCDSMEYWDYGQGMCQMYPMEDMKMLMFHGNGFIAGIKEQGPRAKNRVATPNMFMVDLGTSISEKQFLNLDLMGTVEKWSLPRTGYPELLQIGETQSNGDPFIDAQHPHSSPIMGLTLSDTISIGENKNYLKIFIAPRGESTDGPVAFMHRATGMLNPDAPLGHHIGQDVGHVTSTVIGAGLRLNKTIFEASVFHGKEPQPTHVDLPIGTPNSFGLRITQIFSDELFAMASFAKVQAPEPDDTNSDHIQRYSTSVYYQHSLNENWKAYNSLIWGRIDQYDHASFLNSFLEEFWFQHGKSNIWGRVEVLQRTPNELFIASTDLNHGRWVAATTLGYTHQIYEWNDAEMGAGASITKDFLPAEYRGSYGGNPYTEKIFLQISGMKMLMNGM